MNALIKKKLDREIEISKEIVNDCENEKSIQGNRKKDRENTKEELQRLQ